MNINEEIIDFHVHLFPDRLAERALIKICNEIKLDRKNLHTKATADSTKKCLLPLGIKKAVVTNISVSADRERRVNDFAISLLDDSFFSPLGSVHPKSENIEKELLRLAESGIKGIKLHPDFMGLDLHSPLWDRIFRSAEELGLFVLLHSGYNPFADDAAYSTPEGILKIHEKHEKLKIIAAHLGGYGMAKRTLRTLVGTQVYLDTSLSYFRERESDLVYEILSTHSENRILFGSDSPWSSARAELEFIKKAPIEKERMQKILYKNAERVLSE